MRCLSSHTRKAASKSALVRVSVPAAAIVVAGSELAAFLPFRPRLRERFCDFAFLTRRAPAALIVRWPLLFIKSLIPKQLPDHQI
jgi:hypothetical protein